MTALEAQGLLARSASPDDGRVALVQITTRGRRVQRRLREAQDEIFAERLTHWSQQDASRWTARFRAKLASRCGSIAW